MKSSLIPVFVAAFLVLLTSGCGNGSTADPPAGPPSTDETATGTLVLQVERTGGFLPVTAAFAQVPELTVYSDGRAFTHGPQIAIYPPPALPNLLVHELSEEQLAALVELSREAGLLAETPDYGNPPIADAATTVVTLRADGTRYVHEAYALTEAEGLPGMEEGLPEIGPDAQQARDVLSGFIDDATQIVTATGDERRYEPSAFAVLALPARDGNAGTGTDDPAVEPTVVSWPLPEVSLEAATSCVIVDGEAADTLRATLVEANMLTRFEQNLVRYEVAIRPLLPGEQDCADVAAGED